VKASIADLQSTSSRRTRSGAWLSKPLHMIRVCTNQVSDACIASLVGSASAGISIENPTFVGTSAGSVSCLSSCAVRPSRICGWPGVRSSGCDARTRCSSTPTSASGTSPRGVIVIVPRSRSPAR
jgi:hypothetical protein